MYDKLKLNDGDTLTQESQRSKGPMAEMDISTYSIINAQGTKVGSVVYTDHTAIRGGRRTQTVKQRDSSDTLIVDVSW